MEALMILILFGAALVPCGMLAVEGERYVRDLEALQRGEPLPGCYEARLLDLRERRDRGEDVTLELAALRHEMELTLRLYAEEG